MDLNSAEVNKKLDFAVEQSDAGYSELEVRSSMILSEIIGDEPEELIVDICDNNYIQKNETLNLTQAERDFLYFFPVDINVLRDYVKENYNDLSDENYELLFAEAMNLNASMFSDVEDEDLELIDTSVETIYASQNNYNEYIDLRTGELIYTENLISVPGINGFDFNLDLKYESFESRGNDYYFYTMYTDTVIIDENGIAIDVKVPFLAIGEHGRSDADYYIAAGWRFDLPYYSKNINGKIYIPGLGTFDSYALPDGIEKGTESAVVNNVTDTYDTFTIENGEKYYFDRETGYICMHKDRYGNKIEYLYDSSTSLGNLPVQIKDTAGRLYNFVYTHDPEDYYTQYCTITSPDNSTIKIKYSGTPSNETLDEIIYNEGTLVEETKSFTYTICETGGSFSKPASIEEGSFLSGYNYALLSSVDYPYTSTTYYTYESALADVGMYGSYIYYRIAERKDNINENRIYYIYDGNFTGYPNNELESEYEFGVQVYNDYTMLNYYKHNNNVYEDSEHLGKYITETETSKYNYSPNRRYEIEKTEFVPKTNLVKKIHNYYYATPLTYSSYFESIVDYTYDGFSVTSYNDLKGNTTDEQYKTYITYDSTYKLPLTKTYMTDSSTTVRIVNTLSSDKKNIICTEVYVNNVLKEKTEYTYDSYGNITQTKEYTDVTQGEEEYILTNYSYADNQQGRNLDNVYMTSKTVVGVKDIDGNNINTDGNVTFENEYDILGRVVRQTDAKGYNYFYEYDAAGRITSITRPRGTETRSYACWGGKVIWVYKPCLDGIMYGYDDFGHFNGTYRFNENVEQTTAIEAYGFDSYYNIIVAHNDTYDTNGYYKKVYTYDDWNNPLTLNVYNSNNNLDYSETYSYSKDSYYPGDYYSDAMIVTTKVYDDTELLSKSSVSYNMYGEKVKETIAPDIEYIQDTTDRFSSIYYTYDKYSQLTSIKYFTDDPDVEDYFTFDEHVLESYEYDYAGRLISKTNALGNTAYINYDALGRKISESDYMGNYVYYTYDALGNVIKTDSPFDGDVRSIKKMYYDANGNLIKSQQSNNADNSTTYTFDTVEYSYDNMNNLTDICVHVSEADGDTPAVYNYTHYEYDDAGQLVKVYAGLSVPYSSELPESAYSLTTYTYDGNGNNTSIKDALNNTETFTYNYNGVMTSSTDRKGIKTDYVYTALGNIKNLKVYVNDTLDYTKNYSYDLSGRLQSVSGTGESTVSYTYDVADRVTSETFGYDVKNYSYDTLGNRTQAVLYVNGLYDSLYTNYTYDAESRLISVSNSTMPNAVENTSYTYDANGKILSATTGGLVEEYEYNDAGLVVLKTHSVNNGDPDDYNYLSGTNKFQYEYNTNGNQRYKYSTSQLYTTSYVYDGAGRLSSEQIVGSGERNTTNYEYDSSGNRVSKNYIVYDPYAVTDTVVDELMTTYTYDKNNRLLSTSSGANAVTSYTYDANGNMLSEGSKTYTYNSRNQLVGFSSGTISATYTYSATGLRTSKRIIENENTRYHGYTWDNGNLIFEYESASDSTYTPSSYEGTYYNYGNGIISHSNTAGDDTYMLYETDAHGDVIYLLDADNLSNTTEENRRYDAFGNTYDYTCSNLGYCGEYYDSESGLIYLRGRYYNPELGRFINEDPAHDGLNWYVYCSNNPIKYKDPTGKWEEGDENLPYIAQKIIMLCTEGYINSKNDRERNFYHYIAEYTRNFYNNYDVGSSLPILNVSHQEQPNGNACVVTCCAMMFSYYSDTTIYAGDLLEANGSNMMNYYTGLEFAGLSGVLQFRSSLEISVAEVLSECKAQLYKGNPVMVEIKYYEDNKDNYHSVVVYGMCGEGTDPSHFLAMDPFRGDANCPQTQTLNTLQNSVEMFERQNENPEIHGYREFLPYDN